MEPGKSPLTGMPQGQVPGRELSIGEVLETTFSLYQRDFSKYFLLFAIVQVVIGVVNALVRLAFVLPTPPVNATPQQFYDWFPGFFAALGAILLITIVVTIVFVPIAQGSAMKLASDRIDKGQADLGAAVRLAASRLLGIWALSIIVGILVVVGFIALIVPGIILGIMFSLAFPALIIENKGVSDSMDRSRQLVGHRWGKSFVLYLVIGIIVVIASVIVSAISAPFGIASPVVSGLLSALYEPLVPILLTVYFYSNVARIAPPMAPPYMMDRMPGGPVMTGQPGMKFCVSCGTQMAATSMICRKCGNAQPA